MKAFILKCIDFNQNKSITVVTEENKLETYFLRYSSKNNYSIKYAIDIASQIEYDCDKKNSVTSLCVKKKLDKTPYSFSFYIGISVIAELLSHFVSQGIDVDFYSIADLYFSYIEKCSGNSEKTIKNILNSFFFVLAATSGLCGFSTQCSYCNAKIDNDFYYLIDHSAMFCKNHFKPGSYKIPFAVQQLFQMPLAKFEHTIVLLNLNKEAENKLFDFFVNLYKYLMEYRKIKSFSFIHYL